MTDVFEGTFAWRNLGSSHLEPVLGNFDPHDAELHEDKLLLQMVDGKWEEWVPEALDHKHPLYPTYLMARQNADNLAVQHQDAEDVADQLENIIARDSKRTA